MKKKKETVEDVSQGKNVCHRCHQTEDLEAYPMRVSIDNASTGAMILLCRDCQRLIVQDLLKIILNYQFRQDGMNANFEFWRPQKNSR
jgi:late competence protein required for DNA uptake (superfamily II DNA/RNA helicase)